MSLIDMDSFSYLLPAAPNQKKLEKKLPTTSQYRILLEKRESREGVLLDTFDEDLSKSAKILFQGGERLLLLDLMTGHFVEQDAPKLWSFAGELEPGPVASLLQNISSLRAFLPVAKVNLCPEQGLLLDDEGKTRARFNTLAIGRGKKTVAVGAAQYLRGYDSAYNDLRLAMEENGASFCRDVVEIYKFLAIKQQRYSPKPKISLRPDASSRESAITINRAFLKVARRNEEGVIADYDTEFLHDYRVSLRKVRSVMSLFKGAFTREDTLDLKQDLAALMQKTNTLRDLDVYLLNKDRYFKLVPDDTHKGLDILFDYFAKERKKEQKRVSKTLRSKSYLKEITRLEKLFAKGSKLSCGPKGEGDSLPFACRLLGKRYDKVCSIARGIDQNTEDKVIHQLRINCKKLRYLMEFFAPLFPGTEINTLIKALKILQDNLGNFNDYSVQQTFLRQLFGEKLSSFGSSKLQVAEGVGALTAMLNRLQRKER